MILIITIDPAIFQTSGVDYIDIHGKNVLYTPQWHYEKKREKKTLQMKIIYIRNKKNQTIPLNGIILSIPTTMDITVLIKVLHSNIQY